MGVVCSSVATVAKHYGMILNYFNNKKQINSKLTQHGVLKSSDYVEHFCNFISKKEK